MHPVQFALAESFCFNHVKAAQNREIGEIHAFFLVAFGARGCGLGDGG
jgi:hypothetical protein